MIRFFVPGAPRGKGRPRFRRAGNFVRTYTDAKTLTYEDAIKFCALQATDQKPTEAALKVFLNVCVGVPMSYSKKRKEACFSGLQKPIGKPDIDNIAKIFLDAMNKVVYKDDTQVIELTIRKEYGDQPGVIVTIMEAI